jgi:hypothetical protein
VRVAWPPNRNKGEEGAAHRTGMVAGVGLVRASWRGPTHERIERLRV